MQSRFTLFTLLPLAVFGLLFLAGLGLLIARAMRRKPVSVPSCRRCRYAVVGLTGTTCPECGADLERSGVILPGRRPPSIVYVIAMWTLLCPLPITLAREAVVRIVPRTKTFRVTQTVVSSPASGAFVEGRIRTPSAPATAPTPGMVQDVKLSVMTHDAGTIELLVQPNNAAFFYETATGTHEARGPLTGADVMAWMKQAGVEPILGVKEEATYLADQVAVAFGSTPNYPSWSGHVASVNFSSVTVGINQGADELVLLVGVVVWLIGTVVIVIRSRRAYATLSDERVGAIVNPPCRE